jgi:hypothetical protein
MTMSFLKRTKRKQPTPEWMNGFSYRGLSAEAPRIHFSPGAVELAKQEQTRRLAARAAQQAGAPS